MRYVNTCESFQDADGVNPFVCAYSVYAWQWKCADEFCLLSLPVIFVSCILCCMQFSMCFFADAAVLTLHVMMMMRLVLYHVSILITFSLLSIPSLSGSLANLIIEHTRLRKLGSVIEAKIEKTPHKCLIQTR